MNVRFEKVVGKCYLTYSENLDQSIEEWSMSGPNRFYFTQIYNVDDKSFSEPPESAMNIGKEGKSKGKGKGKGKSKKLLEEIDKKPVVNKPPDYPEVDKPLQTLDVFAGCGGENKRN